MTFTKSVTKALLVTAMLGLAGSAMAASAPGEADPDIVALVPEQYRGQALPVVLGDTIPPMYFRDANGVLQGSEQEFGNAVAAKMGVTMNWEIMPFAPVIPGLQAGRYVATFYGLEATAERAKIIDVIAYYKSGLALVAATDSGVELGGELTDLCGHTLGGMAGASGAVYLESVSTDKCVPAGLKPIEVLTFPDTAALHLAVKSKRVEAMILFNVAAGYLASSDAQWKLVGPVLIKPAISGLGVSKESGLTEAFQAAIKAVLDDGTDATIRAKYNLKTETFDPVINPNK
jgi:polar amino acid transport system substrate-binding protein